MRKFESYLVDAMYCLQKSFSQLLLDKILRKAEKHRGKEMYLSSPRLISTE